ncbi:putative Molybdopterin cofactor biosynthetic protein [Rhodotorula toruloides ATCC 204091]|uniref:Putative Molybdopterin cofactor n=2 Tax=Rhodotorula toruloides TaxID=5286 RepID=A0A2T0A4J5_RHOTO|nr:putative Molybdopterin cofactor biosynthetic protein [Rhodotorula toruloides ATCC 204091]PRQ72939.1 putative Molybdopterin cofactor [Rhodotorula toruloides]
MLATTRTAPARLTRAIHAVPAAKEPLARPLAHSSAPHPPLDASLALRKLARERIAAIDQLSPSPPRLVEPQPAISASPSPSPALTDSFGRKHDYLRISLTEKCNLRCTYCMPETGNPNLLPPSHLLTTPEIERVARMFVRQGVRKIRLTGGEPTVRKDLLDVVERLGRLPLTSLGMTSNGVALPRKLPSLVSAGLTHLNLSLDTLDPLKYELMTRRRGFERVIECLEMAEEMEGLDVKLNVVVIRGLNDMEVPQFVEMTKNKKITVRFIEYMPFEDNRWSTTKLVPSASLLSTLTALHPTLTHIPTHKSDTTRHYAVPGWKGKFGFISSMTDHFCGGCSRLRVGADGGMKVCLFGPPVLSLRPLLRSPAPFSSPESDPDAHIIPHIARAVWGKKFAHDGLGGAEGIKERGRMGAMVGIGATEGTSASLAPTAIRARPSTRRTRLSPLSQSARTTAVPLHLLTPTPSPFASTVGIRSFSSTARRATNDSSRPPDDKRSPASPPSALSSPSTAPPSLTHIDPTTGKASMVSVSQKASTVRSATAEGEIYLGASAFSLIDFGDSSSPSSTMKTKKGDVLSIAQLAGLMGSKHTSLLIPLCHPLSLSHIHVSLSPIPSTHSLRISCTAECVGPTGVEMEALTGVSVAALTVWDMCKAVAGREMRIGDVRVVRKSGGKSGDWERRD